jgi:hypothetical protein
MVNGVIDLHLEGVAHPRFMEDSMALFMLGMKTW